MKGMKIETEKVITETGNRGRKITGLYGLGENNLPKEYRTGTSACIFSAKKITLRGYSAQKYLTKARKNNSNVLDGMYRTGETLDELEFQLLLEFLNDAGTALQEINAARRELKKSWHGTETFVI